MFDDSPIDQAVEGVVNGIFFNQGHVCCAGSRPLVQESIAEMSFLVAKPKNRINVLRVGNPLTAIIDVGAITLKAQLDTISRAGRFRVTAGVEMYQSAARVRRRRAITQADGITGRPRATA